MKKLVGILIFLISFSLFAQVEATHDAGKSYFKENIPEKPESEWSDEDKSRVMELQTEVNLTFNKFNEEVVKRANKLTEENGFTYSWNPRNAIPKARHDVYQKGSVFGKPNTYFNGSEMEDAVRELWEVYGVKVHFELKKVSGDGCGLLGDDCSPAPNTIAWPDSIKVENRKIVDYKGYYEVPWIIDDTNYHAPPQQTVVASDGLFTNSDIKQYGGCNIEQAKQALKEDVDSPKIDSGPDGEKAEPILSRVLGADKIGDGLRSTFGNMLDEFNGTLFGTDCSGESLSAVGQFTNISRALNLTNNPYIMQMVNVTQQIAFTLAIVLIAFYALMFTAGFENMDPVKFGIRLFLSLLAINYLPWLMQDVLNLNNMLVYNIATLKFDFGDIEGSSTDILMGAVTAVLDSIQNMESITENLVVLLFSIIVAFVALIPILKIIIWWYIRLLSIFLGAIVGPIMIALAALPQTADKTKKWVTKFIGSVFSQVFMVLALMMTAVILSNLGGFGEIIDVGWFGRALLVLACIFFLAEVPSFASSFFENFSEKGGSDVTKLGAKGLKKASKPMGRATKAGAIATGGAAVGLAAATTRGGLGAIGAISGAKAASKGKHASSGLIGGLVRKTNSGNAGYQRGKAAVTGAKQGYSGGGNATGSASTVGQTRSQRVNGKLVGTRSQKVGTKLGQMAGAAQRKAANLATGQTWANNKQTTHNLKNSAVQKKDHLKRKLKGAVNTVSQPFTRNGSPNATTLSGGANTPHSTRTDAIAQKKQQMKMQKKTNKKGNKK